jgi:hypothetical protein
MANRTGLAVGVGDREARVENGGADRMDLIEKGGFG